MSALGGIYAALKAEIGADAGVAALLAAEPVTGVGVNGRGVYDDGGAPQATQAKPLSVISPYVTVGAGTEVPQSTFGSRGWNCTVQIKVTGLSESVGQAIVGALSGLLFPNSPSPKYLAVPGFSSTWVHEFTVQPTLVSSLAGIVTREVPVIVRVFAT